MATLGVGGGQLFVCNWRKLEVLGIMNVYSREHQKRLNKLALDIVRARSSLLPLNQIAINVDANALIKPRLPSDFVILRNQTDRKE